LHGSVSCSLKDSSLAVLKCTPVAVASLSLGRLLSGLPVLRFDVPKNASAGAGFPALLTAISLAFSDEVSSQAAAMFSTFSIYAIGRLERVSERVADGKRMTAEPMVFNPTQGTESVTLAKLLCEDDRTACDDRSQPETGECRVRNRFLGFTRSWRSTFGSVTSRRDETQADSRHQ
jgi:hypothetical protein